MVCVEKTGKTVEEAVDLALTELAVPRERIAVEVVEAPSKGFLGFGSKPAKVKVSVIPINPVEEAQKFLNEIFGQMNLDATLEQSETEDAIQFVVRGNDLGTLIGKHGQTLDALQYLVNLAANRDAEHRVRILLDVEDYRKRRSDTLIALAHRLADKVKRRGDRVALEPMSPQERRTIHMALQGDPKIATYSEGNEPYRKVVIALKK
ncbi:MAG: RNA-binding cell elongation regulator Jag/EloR [Sporomusaceae bacterium]|nr:RNA-binding cell elongation regulator Jag/EloR [Sporomusaceae bacterium]